MTAPVYFLTWTTYGAWLHGDERGSVDCEHNTPGTPCLPPDSKRQRRASQRLRDPPFVLSTEMRAVVGQAVRDHAAHRSWRIFALNVRVRHVHVIVDAAATHTPEAAMQQFKSWATRRLISAGFATSQTRIWTDHGSTRYMNTDASLAEAIDYVLNRQ